MTEVVDIARAWIGTPYVHQASRKGAGTDCLGLIRGIWRELYGREPTTVPAYSADWDEAARDDTLWTAAKTYLVQADAKPWQVGQVLLFRMRARSVAKHLGILSAAGPTPKFIHAYSGHGVVESPLSSPWKRRVVARFTFERD